MRSYLTLLFLLFTLPATAQDHRDVVVRVKAELVARNIDITGPCGAFKITKRVAWVLRAEQAGLLDKPGGNQCEGFATDVVAYPSGQIFDILSDGGTENGPAWQDKGIEDRDRYRPAVDPGDVAGTPTTPIPASPPPATPIFVPIPATDLSPVLNALAVNQALLLNIQAQVEAGRREVQEFREAVKSKWVAGTKFVGKYILPAVAGLVGGWKLK